MNNVIDIVKENEYLISKETWTYYFAWFPTKTGSGSWTWLRPYMVRVK